MRKYLNILVALALAVLPLMPNAIASDQEDILVYTIVNDSTSAVLDTSISTSTIIPGKHRILGFTISPNVSGSGTVNVGLWDATSTTTWSSTSIFVEAACANTTTQTVWLARPKPITNGVQVSQGANCAVMIYYERTRP